MSATPDQAIAPDVRGAQTGGWNWSCAHRAQNQPVELILRKLGEDATEADLLEAYPWLKHADIQAALAYAVDSLAHETILLQPA